MIYFVSLEPISSGLKSYSENGQQFYSSNFADVYPWSILIILVLAALPLLIHLKTKNNLDSKFLFSIKGFSINALLILLTIFFASQKEDNFEDQYDAISVQLDAENKFLFPRMEDFAYIDKKGIDDIFNKIALSDKSLTSLNNIVINKYHSRHLPEECNRNGLFETGGVSLMGQELADFIVVDKSYKEKISSFLNKKNIKHNVLNAKQHEQEAKIIAEAGKVGAVTIATNMAGRGTDIKLGGNKNFIEEGKINDKEQIKKDENTIKNLGGLFIIGTERHESRRIDNQLRGRSGRQGDPGGSIFFISLQDELMRIFGGDSIDGVLKKLGLKVNESIDHPWINKAMERAQKKVESRNFDIRKTLIKFDDVMNDQRQVIFSQRLNILKNANVEEVLEDFLDEVLQKLKEIRDIYQKSNNKKNYLTEIKNITGNAVADDDLIAFASLNDKEFLKKIKNTYLSKKKKRIDLIGEKENNDLEKKIFLQIIDFSWRSHLQYLEQLRQVIGLRSYGQKDPLSEFKKEAFSLFEILLEKIKNDIIKFLLNLNIVISDENKKKETKKQIYSDKKIGRNERCPCGSDKKYKNCCGAI